MRYQPLTKHSDAQQRVFMLEVFVTTSQHADVHLCNECKMYSYRTLHGTGAHKDESLSTDDLGDLASAEYLLGRVVPYLSTISLRRIVDALIAAVAARADWAAWRRALIEFRSSAHAEGSDLASAASARAPRPLARHGVGRRFEDGEPS